MDCVGTMEQGFEVVVHEVGHDDEVDDLGGHEPVSYVLGEETHGSVCVEFGVGEDPEDDEEYSGYSLGGYKMGGV